jgi:3'(2'), 5'-bisphosphate nucleotidase
MGNQYHAAMANKENHSINTPETLNDWRPALAAVGGPEGLIKLAQDAAAAIITVYNRPSFETSTKADGSPVSEADLVSAALIEKALEVSGVPVVCEESFTSDAVTAPLFWLVDPLDGTKEFLNRTGEFSVNIALIADGKPVVGVVGIPVSGEVFVAVKGRGVLRAVGRDRLKVAPNRVRENFVAAISRSNLSEKEREFLDNYPIAETLVCGSAIKFCRVAEGLADVYVRFGRTMEWDTAAGQCIAEEAGCSVVDATSRKPLTYGKSGFENSYFICSSPLLPSSPSAVA